MARIAFLLFLSIFVFRCKTEKPKSSAKENLVQGVLITSRIATQTVLAGSSLTTYFVIPNPLNEKLDFNLLQIPDFGKENNITANGKIKSFHFNPKQPIDKEQFTSFKVVTNRAQKELQFKIKVIKPVGQIHQISNKIELAERLAQLEKKPQASTFFLTSGNYDTLVLTNIQDLTIVPATNQAINISKIKIVNCHNLKLQSLNISGKLADGKQDAYINIDSLSSSVHISNCWIASNNETTTWSFADWKESVGNGIHAKGTDCVFTNNLIRYTHHGIETNGSNSIVSHNIILGFSGDAIRNTASNCIFDSNYMADALIDDYYEKDGNHDDLYQSWTFDEPIKDVKITNNIAINWTGNEDSRWQSKNVQGIACFDGFEENWLIENNLIILEHPHGIALFGAKNCQIKNNSVLPNPFDYYQFESEPWIMIASHKDGRPSNNNLIHNNLVSELRIKDETASIQQNTLLDSLPSRYFMDYRYWIFTPKK